MTPHFSLGELIYSRKATEKGIDNTPPEELLPNLAITAATLEQVRRVLGNLPITITSGYRNPRVNQLVGGAATSAHLQGLAADFVCPAYGSPERVMRAIYTSGIAYDQLLLEHVGGSVWLHLGLSTKPWRRESLEYVSGLYSRYSP